MARITNSPKASLQLELERRKSFTFRVGVLDSSAAAIDLTGCTMRFVLKPDPFDNDDFDSTNLLVNDTAAIPEPEDGYGIFSFQAAELDMDPAEYFGTVVLWTATGFSMTLLPVVLNLRENSESDSVHRTYNDSNPPSEVEITLRGTQVVNVNTANIKSQVVFRGPCIRTTAATLNSAWGGITSLPVVDIRGLRYPDGKEVELGEGDLVFAEGSSGVGATVVSVTEGVATLITRIIRGG